MAGGVNAGLPANRYKNAAIAALETASAGLNSRLPPPTSVPVEIPLEANHAISLKNMSVVATSTNGDVAGATNAGDPANRYKNAAIAALDTGAAGWKLTVPSGLADPVVIPVARNQSISA